MDDRDVAPYGDAWDALRAMRADPPGRASTGRRRRVFAASLEQSEQLWRASIAVAPAAQPITAFYGLSQAGRALSAALCGSNDWVLSGHGLMIDPPAAPPSPVADVVVKDKGTGSFQQMAALLRSPTLTSPTGSGGTLDGSPGTPLGVPAHPAQPDPQRRGPSMYEMEGPRPVPHRPHQPIARPTGSAEPCHRL
jgi:hypothetical protein